MRPARHRLALAVALVVPVAGLAACGAGGSGDDPSRSPAPPAASPSSPPASPSASPSATPTAPTGPGTDDPDADAAAPAFGATGDAEPSAGASLTVTGLRIGTHEGFDRVVVDLGGTGAPGWLVQRTGTAVEDPTGDVVDLGGDGVLAVHVTGLGYPFETGVTELPVGTRTEGGTVVTGAEFTGTFEGQTQVFLGLVDPQAPYRVFLLENPTRLVIDVQRSMA
jgi:hypothetical protein